jgi:hypothetical protein
MAVERTPAAIKFVPDEHKTEELCLKAMKTARRRGTSEDWDAIEKSIPKNLLTRITELLDKGRRT